MIHLVTGGSGSGKSQWAEDLVTEGRRRSLGGAPCLYIATMQPFGAEAEKRIARHHALRRGKGFDTIERYRDLEHLHLPENTGVLLECISNLAANELFSEVQTMCDAGFAEERIIKGVQNISRQTGRLVVVSNEISSDTEIYSEETRQYIALVGKVNRRLSHMADRVTEVVYGIPVPLK